MLLYWIYNMKNKIYFDNNATTVVDKRVVDVMLPYFTENYENPSSAYFGGQNARGNINKARKQIADVINANPEEIVITSCGTESNNTVIKG